MSVEVLPEPRQALRRSARLGMGLAGDGLLVRMRSTVIAMLGVVTAVGLALVAVVSQVGWPSVLSGPLPQAPGPSLVRNATIVAPASPSAHRGSTGGARRHLNRAPPPPAAVPPNLASELTAASPVEAAPSPPRAPRHPSAPDSKDEGSSSPQTPAPSPGVAPAPSPNDEPDQGAPDPPTGKTPAPPVVATPESPESSPGHSGESHGNGGGPPPWAGHDGSDASHDDDSWDHGHDDRGGGWGHH
jgi:hypothetical protein